MQNLLGQILRIGHLGLPWCPPGTILGLSCAHLVATFGYLGPSWAHLGPTWGDFPSTLPPADFNPEFLTLFLESSDPGCFQSYCWSILGAILGHLGPSCSHLGAILDHIGRILGLSGAFLGPLWPRLRKICWGKFCVTQNLLRQILRNAKFAVANFA